MCQWGDTTQLPVPMLNDDGTIEWKDQAIDRCLTPLVRALNSTGMYTLSSCCGHGKSDGLILLHDGRVITIEQRTTDEYICAPEDNDPDKVVELLVALPRHEMDHLSELSNQSGVRVDGILRQWMASVAAGEE